MNDTNNWLNISLAFIVKPYLEITPNVSGVVTDSLLIVNTTEMIIDLPSLID